MSTPKVDIPIFDNQLDHYKEFRKRCLLYKARMKLDGKVKQVGLAILGTLTGLSWTACESLADAPDKLEDEDALDKILAILDKRFKYEKVTELPEVFEDYFYKGNRRPKETMFEYIQHIRQSTARISEYNVVLPDEIQGWLLMRRAGLTDEQKSLVMTQCGKDLKMEKVCDVLQTTFGQTQVMSERYRREPKIHFEDDDDHPDEPHYDDT